MPPSLDTWSRALLVVLALASGFVVVVVAYAGVIVVLGTLLLLTRSGRRPADAEWRKRGARVAQKRPPLGEWRAYLRHSANRGDGSQRRRRQTAMGCCA